MNGERLLVRRRLRSHRLTGRRPDDAAAVVRSLGALQAQDHGQSLWAIGVRLESGTAAAVEQAIAAGEIVRTWPLRGTLHWVPPEDVGWMLALSAPRVLAATRRRREQLGLSAATVSRAADVLAAALVGGGRVTRGEAAELFARSGIDPAGQRAYHLLVHLALSGLVCLGPPAGAQPTFVLLDEWVPPPTRRALAPEDALPTLAVRYVTSHGPVTARDFAWWAGLTLTDARRGLAAAGDRLATETAGELEWWSAPDLVADPAGPDPRVLLLPGFDEYLLGYADRGAILVAEHAGGVVPGGNGVFRPMVVVDGRVVGTWRRSVAKGVVRVVLEPFGAFGRGLVRACTTAAARYGAFVDRPVQLVLP